MKEHTETVAELELVGRLKDEFRREIQPDLQKGRLADRLADECRDLARNMSGVIGLLQRYGFEAGLSAEDRDAYARLMAGLSIGGLRCRVLVEEAKDRDEHALLEHMTPDVIRAQ